MSHKTNAARFLDELGIDYELKSYKVDPERIDAVHIAEDAGLDITQVYKTIVCKADNEFVVACLQGDLSLNLKELAKIAGAKRCELIAIKDLPKITGYIRGGCSPLAMKRKFRTFIDNKALLNDKIYISAGIRGLQIFLSSKDLAKATGALFCDISQA